MDRRYLADRYPDARPVDEAARAAPPAPGAPAGEPVTSVAPARPGRDRPTIAPSRRRVLGVAGLGGGVLLAGGGAFALAACSDGASAGGAPTPRATVTSFPPARTLQLRETVSQAGSYVYLPFDVGPGVPSARRSTSPRTAPRRASSRARSSRAAGR